MNRLILLLLIISAVLVSTPNVFAKTVSVEWKEIKGAERYEISIEQEDKVIEKKISKELKWSGELPTGAYTYKLRSIDKLKRAGPWSKPLSLAVMPEAVKPIQPLNGAKTTLYHSKSKITLKWEPIDGVEKYFVEIRRAGNLIESTMVTGTRYDVSGLHVDEYSWSIAPVLAHKGRAPATQKNWKGKLQSVGSFSVQTGTLAVPEILYPKGKTFPPEDNKQKLVWREIEGAEMYEVLIAPNTMSIKGRDIASSPKVVRLRSNENALTVKLPKEGSFRWSVRALANIDENKNADAVGPVSETAFQYDKNAVFRNNAGYVAISAILAPYSYKVVSPKSGIQATFNSAMITARASGEYWYGLQTGVSAAVEMTQIQVMGKSYSHNNLELHWKYRLNFSDTKYGWYFNPKAGLELRQYQELRPVSRTEIEMLKLSAVGPSIGADIRKQFTDSFSLGIRTAYFLPLLLSGADVNKPSTDASLRNLSIGAQMFYWLTGHWGMGAGAIWDLRSISYQPGGQSKAQEVYMDGTYFFGSLLYSF